MARLKQAEEAGIYQAAQQWVDRALRQDDSLFTPGQKIWTLETLDDFLQRVDAETVGQGTFMGRFEDCLIKASPDTIQLAAELLYMHFLIDAWHGGESKRQQITEVMSWARREPALSPSVDDPLDSGVCDPSVGFGTQRHLHLRTIALIAVHLKQRTRDERDAILDDPWRFKQATSDANGTDMQSSALQHLVHPDKFERSVALRHKHLIVKAFAARLDAEPDDVDRDLLVIRERLTDTYGKNLDFYDGNLRPQWDEERRKKAWDDFIHWASRFVEHPVFEEKEREFKLAIAGQIQVAREAVEGASDDWTDKLDRAFKDGNRLVYHVNASKFLQWCADHDLVARAALPELWGASDDVEGAVRNFLEQRFPADVMTGRGTRANLASFLAMGTNPYHWPVYRAGVFTDAYKLTGYPLPDEGGDAATTYGHALGFLDTVIAEGLKRGFEFRDRLDAECAAWAITSSRDWYKELLPPGEHEAFLSYREGIIEPPPSVPDPLEKLADELLFQVGDLRKIASLLHLNDKRQMIFQGPPGTGKTYVARKLAECLAGSRDRVRLVQFHPSYAYEDFVQGYRPSRSAGQLGFNLEHGPLIEMAEAAENAPDAKHFLVIDE
ncbi:MAG: AAA family ATPase, partial [Chloroflexi bacterium]|nr:AAA family ATPase [Chloroflexota bacterium]